MRIRRIAMVMGCWAATLAACATEARADYLVMRDGSTRQGTIVSRDDSKVMLRIDDHGFHMTISVPMDDIAEVHLGAKIPTPAASSQISAASTQASATTLAAAAPQANHFFREWFLLGLGTQAEGLDPETLSPEQEKFWAQSLQDDASGNKPAELVDLNSVMRQPHVDIRLLNKLSMRHHQELFGVWLGKLRWDQTKDKYHVGQFDLEDVTGIETPTLIGLLRSATQDALNPLRRYYPLPLALADLPKASRPTDPLTMIPMSDAQTVRSQAFYAAAVLAAQLKLEPNMPAIDRAELVQQAGNVHAIIAKCNELIPVAEAEAAKAQRERELQAAQKFRSNP